jgi:arylsulfatase A-like enzyme
LISQSQGEPFFLYWNPVLPHANNERTFGVGNGAHVPDFGPYTLEDWPDQDRGHAAMITRLDSYVGRLLDHLRLLGLERDTCVIFTSDNGPHNESRHNLERFQPAGPLRGIKRSLHEGGIRVPTLCWWPGRIAAGQTSGHVGYFGDWMATAAELAGAEVPPQLDSISFVPTLLGNAEQPRHRFLYWEFHERSFQQAALMEGRWKGIRRETSGHLQLFDLQHDLGEQHDVAAEQPKRVEALQQYLDQARSPNPHWPAPQ